MSGGNNAESAFNVKDAMARLGNNKKLYEKLLTRFLAEYSDFYEKLRAAVDGNDLEGASHLAHTMKGLAGNLGADDLQAASLAVEILCKAGSVTPEMEENLEKFSRELNRALDAVRAGVNMEI
ncbi:MAG: Hpt domain-containing protein [Synergistaceae bacterium]|nr:Hpt domain-containing protein [Synergistaceae bacterium]